MKIRMNWALFLLTAAAYVFYPVWHLPLPWPAQWALLNIFILISAGVLYSPLDEVSLDVSLPELKELWPVILLTAAVCLPFWLTYLPTGYDDQSHAGPAAWLLGRLTSAIGLNILFLPVLSIPIAAMSAAAAFSIYKKGISLPTRRTAALALAAAGNLFFFASLRFGLADAIGRFETVLRYPPLTKFIYLLAYLLFGVHEALPRAVQFSFMILTAVYMLRLLKFLKAEAPPVPTCLLILFFPTFFNLSLSTELEAGTVLFFTAAIYHFIKAADTGEREQFLKCAFWTSVGFFNKQLMLGLMLSFVPVLAVFRFIYPKQRAAWEYGLKTLAIPAVIGLPFILLSSALGIRNSALICANLLDPQIMLWDIKNIYETTGPAVTALLAIAAIAGIYRHRGRALALLFYFAISYYIMISATAAVGCIRHAQPFYITLVLLLALWAADTARSRPALKIPLYSVILALLVFQSVFARNPYQRKTAFNFRENSFPYWEAAGYLKAAGGALRIYAPMEVEPSHFYLAKAGLAGKILWERTLPPGFNAEKAAAVFREGGYDFLLLPYSPFAGIDTDFTRIAGELTASGTFSVEKVFDYHGNKLILLKKYVRNTR